MKNIFSICLFLGMSLYFNYSYGGCTRTQACGSGGSIECSGTICSGSRGTADNPWVACDGIINYCYADPAPPVIAEP